jgi:hypothetical protein
VENQARLLRDRSIARAPILATLVVGAAAICACASGPAADPQLQLASTEPPPTALTTEPSEEADSSTTSSETLTLHGWLSIVWNDEPHFFLTRDDGQTVEVLLDEQLTQPWEVRWHWTAREWLSWLWSILSSQTSSKRYP